MTKTVNVADDVTLTYDDMNKIVWDVTVWTCADLYSVTKRIMAETKEEAIEEAVKYEDDWTSVSARVSNDQRPIL